MPSRHIRTVSLSGELDRFIGDLVASGRYASASEVVREGLRALMPAEKPGAKGVEARAKRKDKAA
jgi:putative addiction module CopG family antidote